MTRALVTGVRGQDGSILAEVLASQGVEVHGTVRPGAGGEQAGDWIQHELDLSVPADAAALVERLAPDEIYHLGGMSSVALSWHEPMLYATTNAITPIAMMVAAQELARSPRFVLAASGEIFGSSEGGSLNEDSPIAPRTPYGAAKAHAHLMAGVLRSRGLHVSSCVLFNHESPRRPPTFVTRKITMGVAAIAKGDSTELRLGDLSPRRDWGWAPDYVNGMIAACRADEAMDFVFATGESHSVEDFVAAAFAGAGIDQWRDFVRQDPAFMRPGDSPVLIGDPARARRVLGWEPTLGFDEIVASMVRADLDL